MQYWFAPNALNGFLTDLEMLISSFQTRSQCRKWRCSLEAVRNDAFTGSRQAANQVHHESLKELFADEENGGSLLPLLALVYDRNPDPEMDGIDAERKEN
jgi:hypothetical protein